MKHVYLLLSFCCLLLLLTGCRPELPTINPPESYQASSPSQDFEAFWNGMNNNYAFWDIDPTDWDAVYRTYKPLFSQLKSDEEGLQKAYAYYKEMTAQIVDSHYRLTFRDDLGFAPITPSTARLLKRPGIHGYIPTDHYTRTVPTTYLNPGTMFGYSPDSSEVMVAGVVRNTNLLYFRIPAFNLTEWYEEGTASQKATIQYVFDQLSRSGLDGLLLDLRGNPGGAVPDLNFLIGQLVTKPYVYGYYRAKEGLGRLDYLPWVESSVHPAQNAQAFTKPVVVLVDMLSISMAEATAMAVKALPGGNGKIVGERTYGATAPIAPNPSYNAGSFTTPFMKSVYTASMMFRYKDDRSYESVGFPPDVDAPYDGQALQNGKDTQLETAIRQTR